MKVQCMHVCMGGQEAQVESSSILKQYHGNSKTQCLEIVKHYPFRPPFWIANYYAIVKNYRGSFLLRVAFLVPKGPLGRPPRECFGNVVHFCASPVGAVPGNFLPLAFSLSGILRFVLQESFGSTVPQTRASVLAVALVWPLWWMACHRQADMGFCGSVISKEKSFGECRSEASLTSFLENSAQAVVSHQTVTW